MGVCRNTEQTFWSGVHKTDTCWFWLRGGERGYGKFSYKGKNRRAHHLSFIFTYNLALDKKLFLCHTCDNPSCVNPAHLYQGNHRTNILDAISRGRAKGQFTKDSPTAFKRGNFYGVRKLSLELATAIKTDLKTMRQCDVIRKYNVNRDAVRNISRGDTWASLEV